VWPIPTKSSSSLANASASAFFPPLTRRPQDGADETGLHVRMHRHHDVLFGLSIRLNRRMFWNVLPGRMTRWCAGQTVTSRPASCTRPRVGLYKPVSTLKKVVLPAPFGPIRLTIRDQGS